MTETETETDPDTEESTTDHDSATETDQQRPAATLSEENEPGPPGSRFDRRPEKDSETITREKIAGYMFWAAFGLLSLFAAGALFGFYTSVQSIIDIWITAEYQPIFTALFNLVMVVACLVGLSVLVRLLQSEDEQSTE